MNNKKMYYLQQVLIQILEGIESGWHVIIVDKILQPKPIENMEFYNINVLYFYAVLDACHAFSFLFVSTIGKMWYTPVQFAMWLLEHTNLVPTLMAQRRRSDFESMYWCNFSGNANICTKYHRWMQISTINTFKSSKSESNLCKKTY